VSEATAIEALLDELSEPATQSTELMLGLRTISGRLTWTDLICNVSLELPIRVETEGFLTGPRTLTGFAFWKETGVAVLRTKPCMAGPLTAVDEALVRLMGVATPAAAKVSAKGVVAKAERSVL
jgi:hypothetical protein